ncbi:MAG TPA: ATP-binding cassette domain-containing protein [Aliicoccus persicus]|uniref:ATP-binding cassette domain-containing protein n=1 Tax=Aliicoccus persicus TaxID=930138 RepID=A0A921JCS7_9STAP|nr:ATP-binding cassette domain-containing protein [Aliicoccus persicus]
MTYKVVFENVTKAFEVKKNNFSKLKSLFYRSKREREEATSFYALNDISFVVEEGDSVGIFGLNGSGKSTLLDLIGGVTQPTQGNITVNGTISYVAISAGLENDLTGLENIRYKCLMHGLNNREIDKIFDSIVEYSELGEFIHQPLRVYSSGMRSKLGFAIAIHMDPDILIIDEALSVGDKTFANKCLESIKGFQERGKTLFFVSHSTGTTAKMCNKAIWLHFGEMKSEGTIEEIIHEYESFVEGFNQLTKEEQVQFKDKMMESQTKPLLKMPKLEAISRRTLINATILYIIFMLATLYHTWVVI